MATRAAVLSWRQVSGALLVFALVSACNEEPPTAPVEAPEAAKAATGPTVTAANPFYATRDTTLDVHVLGSGFDQGSKSEFALQGVVGPNIRTNRTSYVSSKELVANITVSADAVKALYDVVVTTSSGKKGIGTERFAVEVYLELGFGVGSSSASGVNEAGYIVGRADSGTASNGRAYVWDPGSRATRSLGLQEAYDVNEALSIIGYYQATPTQWTYVAGTDTWQRTPMATLGGTYTFPTNINDVGQVAGRSQTTDEINHATLWQSPSEIVDLGLLPNADYSSGRAINAQGVIVAWSRTTGTQVWDGFVWTPNVANGSVGTIKVLPRYSGRPRNFPESINDQGVIVGYSEDANGFPYAVRWMPLNDGSGGYAAPVALAAGGQPARAYDVNNAGTIVGQVGRNRSTGVAFVWDAAAGMRQLFNPNGLEARATAISDGPTPTVVGWVLKGDFLMGAYTAVRWQVPR
jgi:probable HAF family extracellular repeat protein